MRRQPSNPNRLSTLLGAIAIGALVHVDWHLGRSGHHGLSFNLPYHWLLGLPTAWMVFAIAKRQSLKGVTENYAAITLAVLGTMIGQGIVVLAEVWILRAWDPMTNPERWRVFAEFVAASIISYILLRLYAERRTSHFG